MRRITKKGLVSNGEGFDRGTQRSRPLRCGGSGREHPAGDEPREGMMPNGRGSGELHDRARELLCGRYRGSSGANRVRGAAGEDGGLKSEEGWASIS